MDKNNNKQSFITLCVILVIGIGYIYQMAPSPVLGQIKDRYGIGNEAMLNLAVSIVPFIGTSSASPVSLP